MSGFRKSGGTDLDSVFEPASAGMSTTVSSYRGTGGALTYCPLQYGTQAAATGMRLNTGADLNTVFAAKGSVGYLANPQTWNTWTYNVVDQTQFNSSVALPNGQSCIIPCSSINGTDHQTAVVQITFFNNGTWQASCAATNRYNDADAFWNSYGGGFEQTLYNRGQGNFTTNFADLVANPGTTITFSGNWLKNPTAGAGANYLLSASFSAVFDYTATASNISASEGVNYTEGLKGAAGYNHTIQCNGGFCVDASGNTYGSVSNWNMANNISICYEFNSQGGFNNNLPNFEGPNGALTWLTYVVASVTLENLGGTVSASGSFNLGVLTSWEAYSSGSGTAWPPTYSGNHTLDAAPWTTVGVGAGSQGQWDWNYGSSGGSGGGGVGGCVADDAVMFDGKTAGEYDVGHSLLSTHPYGDTHAFSEITEAKSYLKMCYDVTTARGAKLRMSNTAIIQTENGQRVSPIHLKGHAIPIAARSQFEAYAKTGTLTHVSTTAQAATPADVDWQWDQVVSVQPVGLQLVRDLSATNTEHGFWAASAGSEFMVLHPNLKAAP